MCARILAPFIFWLTFSLRSSCYWFFHSVAQGVLQPDCIISLLRVLFHKLILSFPRSAFALWFLFVKQRRAVRWVDRMEMCKLRSSVSSARSLVFWLFHLKWGLGWGRGKYDSCDPSLPCRLWKRLWVTQNLQIVYGHYMMSVSHHVARLSHPHYCMSQKNSRILSPTTI